MRLSIGDKIGDKNEALNSGKDESNSIISQRKQIYEYIDGDFELSSYEVREFSDDGYSGTDMERPAMQELLTKIKENKIGCIIVKDMSRFSRDYIEMGTYLNRIFPFMGIRFISINDGYDSKNPAGANPEIDTVFKTLLYDLYSRDISIKVKAAYENKCANGEYIFANTPFGYMKSANEKNAVVINEREAEIVRYIFFLAASGNSTTQIARRLYAENIPDIAGIRRPDRQYTDGKLHTWSENAVRRILTNRFYLGEMIYGKKDQKNQAAIKDQKNIKRPKTIKNHHEPVISEEMFVKASQVIAKRSGRRKGSDDAGNSDNNANNDYNSYKSPLIGKMYCAGCGYALAYKPVRDRNKYARFECTKHAVLQIPDCCTYLNGSSVEKTVLYLLNYELWLRGSCAIKGYAEFLKRNIEALRKKDREYGLWIKKIQIKIDMAYEEYAGRRFEKESVCGTSCEQQFLEQYRLDERLFEEEYKRKSGSLKIRLATVLSKRCRAQEKLNILETEYEKLAKSINENKDFPCIGKLTKEAVDVFIKKILVYKGKRMEIEWNFAAITYHKRGMGK